ncbi:hypothetical protein L2E82_17852 [Cichorium intybus]|uniref:Uncharacterized protein n=1 Tax=Cichorium intybus TaxID=13427 RepID=A0ACB9F986_CICIN|nr:hypothetical protein L2E82_17852 [Cichorium intybus]
MLLALPRNSICVFVLTIQEHYQSDSSEAAQWVGDCSLSSEKEESSEIEWTFREVVSIQLFQRGSRWVS